MTLTGLLMVLCVAIELPETIAFKEVIGRVVRGVELLKIFF